MKQSGANSVITSSDAVGRLLGLSSLSPTLGSVMEDLLTYGEGLEVAERDLLVTEVGKQPQSLPDQVIAVVRDEKVYRYFDPVVTQLARGDRLIVVRPAKELPWAPRPGTHDEDLADETTTEDPGDGRHSTPGAPGSATTGAAARRRKRCSRFALLYVVARTVGRATTIERDALRRRSGRRRGRRALVPGPRRRGAERRHRSAGRWPASLVNASPVPARHRAAWSPPTCCRRCSRSSCCGAGARGCGGAAGPRPLDSPRVLARYLAAASLADRRRRPAGDRRRSPPSRATCTRWAACSGSAATCAACSR